MGCVKDREFVVDPTGPGVLEIVPGVLKVNEFVSTGSENVNEFGNTEDWFEIYNPNSVDLVMEAGRWWVSDAGPSNPTKYQMPEVTIPAFGFLVIWCDNEDTVQEQIHTNFALSAAGEHLVIYYDDGVNAFIVDDHNYPPQPIPAVSYGRFPDGEDNWIMFQTPTPGAPNQ
jgi:hypothetical protein